MPFSTVSQRLKLSVVPTAAEQSITGERNQLLTFVAYAPFQPLAPMSFAQTLVPLTAEEGSPVFATNIPKMTCGRCHGDIRLADKFGIDSAKVPAYEDSYHGLASRAGVTTVAPIVR